MDKKLSKYSIALAVVAIILAIIALEKAHVGVFGAITDTSFFDFFDAKQGFKINGTTIVDSNQSATFTGTTTLTRSVSGLAIGGRVTSPATTSLSILYTNSGSPKHCDARVGYIRQKFSNVWAPALTVSVGTSSASIGVTNLLASSTMASTTSETQKLTSSVFDLAVGDKLIATFGDTFAANSSSTYYGNLNYEVAVWCQDSQI